MDKTNNNNKNNTKTNRNNLDVCSFFFSNKKNRSNFNLLCVLIFFLNAGSHVSVLDFQQQVKLVLLIEKEKSKRCLTTWIESIFCNLHFIILFSHVRGLISATNWREIKMKRRVNNIVMLIKTAVDPRGGGRSSGFHCISAAQQYQFLFRAWSSVSFSTLSSI